MAQGWEFDALPASGARRGGDPAEHVFKHDLDTFVREVVQNANDQRVSEPRIDFSFREYEGEPLRSFLESLHWRELEPHLRAAAGTPGARRIEATLREAETRLLALRIVDRGTVGLTGDEDGAGSHFRALCKDTLVSHKSVSSAGGSFGLGKSVLWAFSGLSTVAFNSVPSGLPAGKKPPRFIARVELPSHRVGDQEFSGSGWLGNRATREGRTRAESIWGLTANSVARDLDLARDHLEPGTSILIVGFREPAEDVSPTSDQLAPRVASAATRWFWPAMSFEGRRLHVTLAGRDLDPASTDVAPFVAAWTNRRTLRTTLDEPGDVVAREIPLEVPPGRDGTPAVKGELRLIVRLAPDDAHDPLLGHVACFRGAGMVVKYLDRRALAQAGRPFHAVLAGGEARQPEAPTQVDRAVERFLRLAEPPGHDHWESTNALKETYQRGYAKALDQLTERVNAALRDLLVSKPELGTRAPDRLLKRFPFGARGRPGSAPSSFHFSRLTGERHGAMWRFAGTVRPAESGGRWVVRIGLRALGDGGARLDPLPIAHTTLDAPRRVTAAIREGAVEIDVPRGIEEVSFVGESAEVPPSMDGAAMDLEVTGAREAS